VEKICSDKQEGIFVEKLNKDISAGQFNNVYLFYGEETYLKNDYKNRIKKACIKDDDTINFNQYEGKNIDLKEIFSLADTMPFFADYRLILLENTGLFKKSNDELSEYFEKVPDTTILLFVEDEIDKRSKTFKSAKKHGRVVEFPRQNEKVLEKWVLGKIKKENKQITKNALDLFFSKTGVDMENIASEIEKLLCYTLNKDSITEEDVDAICTEQVNNRIFEMIRAIAEKNQKRALDLYYDLLTLKEPPLRILALLSRQFRLLYQVKELLRLRKGRDEIARYTGIHSFIVRQYISQAGGFSGKMLKRAREDCIRTEEEIKSGKIADKLGVELLIVEYSK